MRATRAMHWHWLALLLAMCLVVTAVHADGVTVRAHLDRDHVPMGGVVTLDVDVVGTAQASKPDLGALRSDFDIVGTSRSSSVSLVNGHGSIQTQWAIRLRPRHAGQLVIPPLEVDGHATAPLTLTVDAAPAPASARGAPGAPVFIRVTPSTRAPYVGQQIDLAVKLFYAPRVGSGSFEPPRGKGIDVQPLGRGARYQSRRHERRYRVLERHYAVTARHAGPINLAPVTFEGSLGTGLAALLGNARSVSARSAPIRLAVRSRPASYGKGAWLPAHELTLHLTGLPASGQIRVGQSLTLTLTEKAEGLPFEALPKPQLPKLPGVDVYPGQIEDHTGHDGHWLQGVRKRTFALVPQQAGTLTIPAITLKWWNVKTGKQAVARLPAHTLTVVAARGGGMPAAAQTSAGAVAPRPSAAPPHANAEAAGSAAPTSSSRVLDWLALGLLSSGMLGLLAFGYWRRRRRAKKAGAGRTHAAMASRRARRAFLDAVRHGNVASQCEALLAWARTERPGLPHLGELACLLDRAVQRDAVAHLQRARYEENGVGIDADELMTAFRGGLVWRREAATDAPKPLLPPLYP